MAVSRYRTCFTGIPARITTWRRCGMLVSVGHGNLVCKDGYERRQGASGEFQWLAQSGARGTMSTSETALLRGTIQNFPFDYMFAGDGLAEDPDAFVKLGRLGEAMITDNGLLGPSGQAAILTYFGQFIDHDITLNTDSDPASLEDFAVAPADGRLTRNARDAVRNVIRNGRNPSLQLDSLYGDGSAVEDLLRDGAKLKVGQTSTNAPNDLPRLAHTAPQLINNADTFPSTALIGDGRNDENLIIAQLHLAFIRFHNAVVDSLPAELDPEEAFAEARRLTVLHYQWLVLNAYLPKICDPATLLQVIATGAGRFTAFSGGMHKMPLEFSVAAFRFGHSMIRPAYEFNDTFGTSPGKASARLQELFTFTGGRGRLPGARLPHVWVIDWSNFLGENEDAVRNARLTDTAIAEGLDSLFDSNPALRNLPARNLRRSYVLAIPTAQQVLAALGEGAGVAPLTSAELDGFAGGLLAELGYRDATPLWFYVLLEAELRASGRHLGTLGSMIVAETLVGLLVEDRKSVWHVGSGTDRRWHPGEAGLASEPIDSFEKFLRFAGVM
jgi:hypothetical protein